MNTYDALQDVTRPNYSVDVKRAIDAGEISANELWRLTYKLSNADFGKVNAETAFRFRKSVETGDRDLYGVYDTKIGEVVLYYDATDDTIDIVTMPEFQQFFKADWMNPRRLEKKTRLSTKQPDQQWKEGQRREIIQEAAETTPEAGRQLHLRQKSNEYIGVYPYMDYTKLARRLAIPQVREFNRLSREKGIPLKKLYASLAHQHSVQNLNLQNAYNYVIKHIDDPFFAAKDAEPVKTLWRNINVLRQETSDLGNTYYLVEAERNGSKWWLVTKDPSLEGGYDANVNHKNGVMTFNDWLLMDKLIAKYGKSEGTKKFLHGANDSVCDADIDQIEKELHQKGWIYPEEGVIRVRGDIATVQDYAYAQETEVNIKTGDRRWIRNTDYVPDDYGVNDNGAAKDTDLQDAAPKNKVDLKYLLNDEYEAIDGYQKMIGQTDDPALKQVLNHILDEEIEHAEELQRFMVPVHDAKPAKKLLKKDAKNPDYMAKTANGEDIIEAYRMVENYAKYYIIAKDRDKIMIGVRYTPTTGKYEYALRGFVSQAEAHEFLIGKFGYDIVDPED